MTRLAIDLLRGLDLIERALINPAAPVAGGGITGSGGHAGTAAAAGPPASEAGACGALSAPAGITSDINQRPQERAGHVGLSVQHPAGAPYSCTVCRENPVDAEAGFDTCDDCHP